MRIRNFYIPRLPQIILVAVALIFLVYSARNLSLINTTQKQVEISKQVLASEAKSIKYSAPSRLIIPTLNVNANVQHVGMNKNGEMEVPSNTLDVAWFAYGAIPGQLGSAVIAGHFNGENGESGVFAELGKLKPGDEVHIQDSKGKLTTFVVYDLRSYAPGYVEEVFYNKNNSQLSLVTCEGVWNENTKSYSERLVVFASINK